MTHASDRAVSWVQAAPLDKVVKCIIKLAELYEVIAEVFKLSKDGSHVDTLTLFTVSLERISYFEDLHRQYTACCSACQCQSTIR